MMKHCSKCRVEKPLTEYYSQKGTSDGKRSMCKSCSIAYQKKYKNANKENVNEYSRKYYYKKRGLQAPPKKTSADRVQSIVKYALKKAGYDVEILASIPSLDGEAGTITLDWRKKDDEKNEKA